MRQFFIAAAFALATGAAALISTAAAAQPGTPLRNSITDEGRAPYRTEFVSYDNRGEADAADPRGSKYHRPLTFRRVASPEAAATSSAATVFETTIDIPGLWLDRDVWIRDTGRTGRYFIMVNGEAVAMNTDSYGMNDYYLTPYLRQGTNRIALEFADDASSDFPGGEMEDFARDAARQTIDNLYIWSQPRIHIFDYTATGHFSEEAGDVILDLDVVMVNSFNTDETINVGYDIYDPRGVLKDYSFEDAVIPGRGCDTVRFRNKVYGTERFVYSAENPALYSVMLSVKQGGRPTEYIPIKVAFGLTDFDGENVTRAGKTIAISAFEGDFPVERGTRDKLRALKRQGVNTIYATRPQQKWFYDMCAAEGLYVVDCAAVECDPGDGSRRPTGTAANDPSLVARFVDRQQAMYYRNRTRPNVIGWAIGSGSGNGYNMYKSYEWLRGVDSTRPAVYRFAEGEWNTDVELPAPKLR
ncbi:MAG: hypothetical protein LBV18_06415 [Alistipes sp.]|jgi:beta-galactosidase|nr:hypothetical protein [Alistipes sp.]